jgi:chondroitin 4-sulfotransferase 11
VIISDTHGFVFVATTRTGSTSIEKYLNPYRSAYKIKPIAGPYNTHCSLEKIYSKYPGIKDYFKFAIVRNPFDWIVSWYSYRKTVSNKNNTQHVTFKDWLVDANSTAYNREGIGLTLSQYDIIKGNEAININFIGRFENLQKDFDTICDKIGIPQQKLPHVNESKHRHYTEYYDYETRSIVYELYAKDIEYFGYEFGE